MSGKFVITLDFELHWGFFDNKDLDSSKAYLSNVNKVIDRMLELSDQYDIALTFNTVGFLFAKNKVDLSRFIPDKKPNYKNNSLNPYHLLDNIKDDDMNYYFAQSILKKINAQKKHEIGTHTFSHYYCNEEGQEIEDFRADIQAAVAIAKDIDIETKSIVFPRNQVLDEYVKVCNELGIITYRGNCWHNLNNNISKNKLVDYAYRLCRITDSYINLTGSNSYKLEKHNSPDKNIINIPASRFLRPYSSKFRFLEPLKLNRIKSGMSVAAKQNKVYHLWWHPHNFSFDTEQNIDNLESIFEHFKNLNDNYSFTSTTMTELAKFYNTKMLFN